MKKQITETGKRVRASAYSVILLLLIIAGCDGITDTNQSTNNQLHTLPGTDGVFSSTVSASYTATLLPSSGLVSEAALVAGNGSVFGIITDGYDKAVKWTVDSDGNISDPVYLGSLPAPYQEADQGIRSMNTNGDIVLGFATNHAISDATGWIWVNGTMALLPRPDDAIRVWPTAVNDQGVVVGQIDIAEGEDGGTYAALWMPPYNSAPILLTRMEDYNLNAARGINNDGIITGWFRSPDMPELLGQWQIDSEGNELSGPTKLDGIEEILVSSVNQDLDVVGTAYVENEILVPYLYRSDKGVRVDLGLLDGHHFGHARSITNRKVDGSILIAGISRPDISAHSEARAVLWSADAGNTITGPVELGLPDRVRIGNRPPRHLNFIAAEALSVNMQGWAVGTSQREDGKSFATLWQPVEGDDGDDGEDGDNGDDEDCRPHPRFADRCR